MSHELMNSGPFYYCNKSAAIGPSSVPQHFDWPANHLAARLDWLHGGSDFALIGQRYDLQSPAKSRTEGRREEEVLL